MTERTAFMEIAKALKDANISYAMAGYSSQYYYFQLKDVPIPYAIEIDCDNSAFDIISEIGTVISFKTLSHHIYEVLYEYKGQLINLLLNTGHSYRIKCAKEQVDGVMLYPNNYYEIWAVLDYYKNINKSDNLNLIAYSLIHSEVLEPVIISFHEENKEVLSDLVLNYFSSDKLEGVGCIG